ncbi:hypothetical protein MTO96_023335 [Rhipicephalus appendiculatus]
MWVNVAHRRRALNSASDNTYQENPEKAPVVLWLQGGPGGSSLFGLFVEHGPYLVAKGGVPELRDTTWAQRYSMLYIDNPVGAGFSFTQDDNGYARNEEDVGRGTCTRPCSSSSRSLTSTRLTTSTHQENRTPASTCRPSPTLSTQPSHPESRSTCVASPLGTAWSTRRQCSTTPISCIQIGLVDQRQADYIRAETARGVDYIKRGRYLDAFLVFDKLINGDTVSQPSYFKNVTGLDFYYNFLLSKEPEGFGNYHAFVDSPAVRKAIHVGNLTFNNGDATESHLKEDIMQSVKPWLASLMDKPQYKVLIYNGQLDIIIAYPLTDNFVSSIPWSGKEAFDKAERKIWKRPDGNGVAGYVRKVGNFTQVLVRNAGHILPYDQPDVALDLITRFIDGKPFDA